MSDLNIDYDKVVVSKCCEMTKHEFVGALFVVHFKLCILVKLISRCDVNNVEDIVAKKRFSLKYHIVYL